MRFLFLILKAALTFGLVLWLGVVGLLFFKQRQMIFPASHHHYDFNSLSLQGARETTLTTPDGAVLQGYFRAPDTGKPIILFFHGNGAGAGAFAETFRFYGQQGFGYLAFSYRGYDESSGETTEANIIKDALQQYDWLQAQGFGKDKIVAMGASLGTGVAVKLAAQRSVAAVALAAPYTSLPDVAQAIYWWVPVRLLMLDQINARAEIDKINAPLYVIHGTDDRVVPYRFGKALFDAAQEPKTFETVPGAGHEVIYAPETAKSFTNFINQLPHSP